ncbi:MAG: efflux RND transporter periplasmic adaptor subunit [Cytophagaceae bacterium]|nr:efflux RND transporter periplasmic adaptor subunit [Cytophagaceae bacterium]MDW8456038.1 efflux RND transporter periplasmic adaptor subunit [Cytophagaceae bacterium]
MYLKMYFSIKRILLTGIYSICFFACSKKDNGNTTQEKFVLSDKMMATMQIAEASEQPLKSKMHFYGKITADNNRMIEIFPVVGGNVTAVYVELGDYVKKNQLLATIRSAEVAGYEKELDDARNDLIMAKNNLKVVQELYEGKLSTDKDVLEAQSQLEKAQTQLMRVQEIYQIYSMKKGAIYEVRSPINGFVIQKNINQDMLLRSDKTDNIFDIAELSEVWAIVNINESDIGQVHLGLEAEITTLSYPDKKFYGKVDKIYNIIDPDSKTMKARVKLQNPEFLLKPDMRAYIKLTHVDKKKMLCIPSSAIIFDKGKNYVVLYKDRDNVSITEVEIYKQVDETTYISKGLLPGDKVMTHNQLLVYQAIAE